MNARSTEGLCYCGGTIGEIYRVTNPSREYGAYQHPCIRVCGRCDYTDTGGPQIEAHRIRDPKVIRLRRSIPGEPLN